jgi:kynurenine formamidase
MCLPGTEEKVRARFIEEGPPRFTRRTALAAAAGATVAAAFPASAVRARSRVRPRVRDLTHTFRAGFPVYAFDPPTRRTLVTVEDDGFYSQEWTFGEHSGTHVDAPGHFITDGRRSPQLRPSELIAPLVVIDISERSAVDPDAVVRPKDLRSFERRHGRIPRGALVAMYSGWETRVGDPQAYKNPDASGTFHFPGFGIEAVEWLLAERDIAGIGVDTLSLDHGPSQTFDVHLAVLGADRYGIENLANLNRIPAAGATGFVGLIPWEEGSGGPARVLAVW